MLRWLRESDQLRYSVLWKEEYHKLGTAWTIHRNVSQRNAQELKQYLNDLFIVNVFQFLFI